MSDYTAKAVFSNIPDLTFTEMRDFARRISDILDGCEEADWQTIAETLLVAAEEELKMIGGAP